MTETETPEPEAESPEDFIRRWQAAADSMVVTGDASTFLAISKGCQACRTYAQQVLDVYADGGAVDFEGSEVLDMVRDSAEPPTYVVDVRAARLRIVTPGEPDQTFPAATQRYRMILRAKAGSFIMRNYAVI
ncbi:hypothetical protein [Nocardioides hwasunensis]|uniref:DUF4440 domain-containing protein n=1 Tax=Nocardioides hwasunensis TaxID=397258 RepID=A0ABR8MH05_9ACTN|nr:hypothetical protein [Nocardioides hwasunensis]MBD3915354.1 hypothetical protein [Nocardioides hwasunensis]